MGRNQLKKQQKRILFAYILMLLAVISVVPLLIAYWLSTRVADVPNMEVWLHSHALWIARNVLIFACIGFFAALWFIPLIFFVWDQFIWVTASMLIGSIFLFIAWLYLLNAWLKGMSRFFKRKPVY